LLDILNDILDFARIEAGHLPLESVPFALQEALTSDVKMLARQAHAKGLELTVSVHPEVPEGLIGDPGRLRQILTNLIGNAIKFTERDAVAVSVEPSSQDTEAVEIHVAVSDTGVGIPPDKHRQILEPFTQADGSATRKYGGTGLGLAISRQLVEMMGGRLWLESEVGHGSTFHFTARLGVLSEATMQQGPYTTGRCVTSAWAGRGQ
jgi:signal transduction histidine kinase